MLPPSLRPAVSEKKGGEKDAAGVKIFPPRLFRFHWTPPAASPAAVFQLRGKGWSRSFSATRGTRGTPKCRVRDGEGWISSLMLEQRKHDGRCFRLSKFLDPSCQLSSRSSAPLFRGYCLFDACCAPMRGYRHEPGEVEDSSGFFGIRQLRSCSAIVYWSMNRRKFISYPSFREHTSSYLSTFHALSVPAIL